MKRRSLWPALLIAVCVSNEAYGVRQNGQGGVPEGGIG